MNNAKSASPPDFIVHASVDSVGVVVVEDATKGKALTGWIMESDKNAVVQANEDIPLGHKVALVNLQKGEQVIKYGFPIGRTVAAIRKGEHVHVHNTKTEQW